MSAELLRRAADAIHHDLAFGQEHGDAKFLAAVADWLAECADIKAAPDVNASIKIALTDRAIKVARAYLSEAS